MATEPLEPQHDEKPEHEEKPKHGDPVVSADSDPPAGPPETGN